LPIFLHALERPISRVIKDGLVGAYECVTKPLGKRPAGGCFKLGEAIGRYLSQSLGLGRLECKLSFGKFGFPPCHVHRARDHSAVMEQFFEDD
jgi:hypothetical protein